MCGGISMSMQEPMARTNTRPAASPSEEAVFATLQLVQALSGMERPFIAQTNEGTFEFTGLSADGQGPEAIALGPSTATYCARVVATGAPLAVDNAHFEDPTPG